MKDLIDHLEELRVFLNTYPQSGMEILSSLLNKSGVERTTGLKKTMGEGCPYYRKSKDLFLSRDYDKLFEVIHGLTNPLLDEIKKQFRIVEGPNGRR